MELTGKNILIVDDEELLREILVDLFKAEGATTFEASNGVDALVIVSTTKIDAVITDVRMPRGNGIALIEAIHKLESNNPRPLLFVCSGFSDLTDQVAVDLKIETVFPKPFKSRELVEQVLLRFRRA